MKRYLIALLAGLLVATGAAWADPSVTVVKISCSPEKGLFELEQAMLDIKVVQGNPEAMLRQGYFEPRGVERRCVLGNVTFAVKAQQGETSNFMCGGSPEVWLSVQRNGRALIRDVVFGYSCIGHPSLMRMTVSEGTSAGPGPMAELCFADGRDLRPDICETVLGANDFAKKFPLDDDTLRRIVDRRAQAMQR